MGKKKKKKSSKVKIHPLEAELQQAMSVMGVEHELLAEAAVSLEANVAKEFADIEALKAEIALRRQSHDAMQVDPHEMSRLREQTERDIEQIKTLTIGNQRLDSTNARVQQAFVHRSEGICVQKVTLEHEFKGFFAQRRNFVDAFQQRFQFVTRADPKDEGFGRALHSEAGAVAFDNEQRLLAVQAQRDALRAEIAALEARRRLFLQRAGSADGREAYTPTTQPHSIGAPLIAVPHCT